MVELDEIDRKLLLALDQDSRRSVAELSRDLKLGRDRIAYRMRQLEEKRVIASYTTIINPATLGLVAYKTYLRLRADRNRIEKIIDSLTQNPNVYWVAECEGAWDLIFVTFAPDPKEFHTLQDEILLQFSDLIIGFSVYTLVEVWFFVKGFLGEKGSESFFFGGHPGKYVLDEIDAKLLSHVSKNSRLSVKELASLADTTPMVAKYRIAKMEEAGVIIGYRIDMNLDVLGLTFFKAQVHLLSYRRGAEEEFFKYCQMHPSIVYFIKQIGDCKMEIEIAAADLRHLNQIVAEMRERFSKLIRNVDTIFVRRQHYNWAPFELIRHKHDHNPPKMKKRAANS